jgi:serine/threonine protein kinase
MTVSCIYDYFLRDESDELLEEMKKSDVNFTDFLVIQKEVSESNERLQLAEFNHNKKLYYIKEINLNLSEKQQIVSEQKILNRLEHCKQIIRDSFVFFDERFYVATQYMCSTLRGQIEKAGLFNDRIIKLYVAQLMIVLQILHQNFIIHCNLRPEYIYFDTNVIH